MLVIGVLSIQGAFAEHKNILMKEIRAVTDLTEESLHGIILPGGESTTMGKILHQNQFGEALKSCIDGNRPGESRPIVFGTCSGMIMLANNLDNPAQGGQYHVGGLDVSVSRNFFGRQINSFQAPLSLSPTHFPPSSLEESKCDGVFIRAPAVTSVDSPKVHVLATVHIPERSSDEIVVAVRSENLIATAFHPELTEQLMWHNYFLREIVKAHSKS